NNGTGTWHVQWNETLGNYSMIVSAEKGGYYTYNTTVNLSVFGKAIVSIIKPQASDYLRGSIEVICNITDSLSMDGIENHTVYLWDSYSSAYELINWSKTNGSGIFRFVWNTTNETLGKHTLICNISNETGIFYTPLISNTNVTVSIYGNLTTCFNLQTDYEIYRDDAYYQYAKGKNLVYKVTFYLGVKDEKGNDVNNANVTLYLNTINIIGYCLTNSSGMCNITWNPGSSTEAGNLTIMTRSSKQDYYTSPYTTSYILLRAFSIPIWEEPTGTVFYDIESENKLTVTCRVNESYANRSIARYPVEIWYGSRNDDYSDTLVSWQENGSGARTRKGDITNITTSHSYSLLKNITLEGYDEATLYVRGIRGMEYRLEIFNSTTWLTVINTTNQTGIIKGAVNTKIYSIRLIFTNTSSNAYVEIEKLLIKDVTLSNATQIMQSEFTGIYDSSTPADKSDDGDMEEVVVHNENPTLYSNGWYITGATGSRSNESVKYGNYSMAVAFNLSGSSSANVIREYYPYSKWANYSRLSFWINNKGLNVTLRFKHYPSGCTYDYNLGIWSGWRYFQPSIESFGQSCGSKYADSFMFIIKNEGQDWVNDTLYLDHVEILRNVTTGTNGVASVQWLPPATGVYDMMCKIDDYDYYNTSEDKDFQRIQLLAGGGVPGEAEGFKVGEANVTSFTREPLYIYRAVATNNDGIVGYINITSNYTATIGINITIWGEGASYLMANESYVLIGPLESRIIGILYNTTDEEGIRNATVSMINYATKERLDTNITLDIRHLFVKVINPSASTPFVNITNGSIIWVIARAEYNHTNITSQDNVSFLVYISDVMCDETNYTFNASKGLWNITCLAPWIPRNVINNSLGVKLIYTFDNVSDEVEGAAIYRDVTPPAFYNLTVNINGSHVNASVLIIDNVNVSTTWASLERLDNGNITNITPTYMGNNVWLIEITVNENGDYNLYVYANDTGGRVNSTMGWFDIYEEVRVMGNISDKLMTNIRFMRPWSSIKFKDITSVDGVYNAVVKDRSYDIGVDILVPENQLHRIIFKSASFVRKTDIVYNLTSWQENGSGARTRKGDITNITTSHSYSLLKNITLEGYDEARLYVNGIRGIEYRLDIYNSTVWLTVINTTNQTGIIKGTIEGKIYGIRLIFTNTQRNAYVEIHNLTLSDKIIENPMVFKEVNGSEINHPNGTKNITIGGLSIMISS
ncbi:MAG: hypothetical protein DRN12_07190, partial [Thermoplasmata archaeon]